MTPSRIGPTIPSSPSSCWPKPVSRMALSEVTIAEDIVDADGNVVFKAGDKMPLRLYYMPVDPLLFPRPEGNRRGDGG